MSNIRRTFREPGSRNYSCVFILLTLLFGVIRTLVSYRGYGFEDQVEQLPLIYRSFESTYLQHDFFVNRGLESVARTNYIRFIRLFSNTPKNLPLLFFIFTVILNAAIALITFLTARTLFRFNQSGSRQSRTSQLNSRLSGSGMIQSNTVRANQGRANLFHFNFFHANLAGLTAAALVMLVPTFHLGASPHLFVTYFIPSSLAAPLVLLAILLAIQKRIAWSMMAGGAASLVHPLFGLETMALVLFAWIVSALLNKELLQEEQMDPEHTDKRQFDKEELKKKQEDPDHVDEKQINEKQLDKEQLDKEQLDKEQLHTAQMGEAQMDEAQPRKQQMINYKPFQKMQLHKAKLQKLAIKLIIPTLLFTVFALVSILPQLKQSFRLETNQFIHIIGHFRHPHHYIPSSFPATHYLLFLFFLGAFSYAWLALKKTINIYHSHFILTLNLSILAACFAGYLFVEVIPIRLAAMAQTFRLLYFFKWTGLLFFAGLMVRFFTEKQARKGYRMLAGAAMVLFVIALFAKGLRSKSNVESASFATLLSGEIIDTPGEQAEEVAAFARQHTPDDAVFLAPHNYGFFRLSAERAIVVDFKSFPFTDRAMLEWYERINDCYGAPEPLNRSGFANEPLMRSNYKSLDDTRLKALQMHYKCSYAILFSETETGYEVVFSNEKYQIIKIR